MSFCCHGCDDNDSHRRAFDESKGIVGIRVRGPVVVCFALQVSLQRAEVASKGEWALKQKSDIVLLLF